MGSGIRLSSDYKDYYDNEFSACSKRVYMRRKADNFDRGKALRYLRSVGINTIEAKQVTMFNINDTKKLVVYTKQNEHEGIGKKIMLLTEAREYFPNYLASKFIEVADGISMKYIQVGNISFAVYRKLKGDSLDSLEVTDITKSVVGENKLLQFPVFSIDYIPLNGTMTAIDFTTAENLGRLGLQSYIDAKSVYNEIESVFRGNGNG